jgi:hypothetical protein
LGLDKGSFLPTSEQREQVMSYYRVASWNGEKVTKMLKEAHFDNFVGNDTECHLNIPDNLLVHDLHVLSLKFDVMIVERHGTKTFLLDTKNKMFKQR